MKRKYQPDPDTQRRQAHRRRLALGRAMHQVRKVRGRIVEHNHGGYFIRIPKILRKHAMLLRWTFRVLGS